MAERRQRAFWVVDYSGRPCYATGYECPPNDDVWWFPGAGVSTNKVFATREEALHAAIAEVEGRIAKDTELLEELRRG